MLISLRTAFVLIAQPPFADDGGTAIGNFYGAGDFIDDALGYAVFPSIGKSGIGMGSVHGNSEVFVGGKKVGKTKMSQIAFGLQLGGQVCCPMISPRVTSSLMRKQPQLR